MDYFSKDELIKWCAQNSLNVFLYNRRVGNGLSATTDQAIASGRPLSVSTNPTFRHIHSYIKPYPYLSLKAAIETTMPVVRKMQEEWSPRSFVLIFENLLVENKIQASRLATETKLKLPATNNLLRISRKFFSKQGLTLIIPPIIMMARERMYRRERPPVLKAYVHQVLHSNSQFQEDLLIDLLLGVKKEGVYVDVGANDPSFNSNTRRFYLRGWRGINIEPGFAEFNKFVKDRKLDTNLNLAISGEVGTLTFYQVGNDSSLSTLDKPTAVQMASTYNLKLSSTVVDVMPLSIVLEKHLEGRHIDFMSVDAEGHDLDVLKSNDWAKYRPTIVMIESNIGSREIIMFLEQHGYMYIFSNNVNALFVDKLTNDYRVSQNISWDFH